MDLGTVDPGYLETMVAALMFTGLRVGGLMLFAPFFSSGSMAVPLKVALTVALTALLYPVYGAPAWSASGLGAGHLSAGTTGWIGIAIGEAVAGLLLGLSLQFILEAAQMAGQVLGVQAGFSLITLLDPQTQADTPALATFTQLLALMIFLQLNVHHWVLRGLAASFRYLPPGGVVLTGAVTTSLLRAASGIWLAGLEMAAPVVAATLLIDVTLGFLAKASPQIPVLFLGLSIKTVVALTVLAGTLALWPRLLEQRFAGGMALGERLLHLAH